MRSEFASGKVTRINHVAANQTISVLESAGAWFVWKK